MASCVDVMIAAFPGRQFYATHLQWQGKGQNGYVWRGGGSTPGNINLILVEFTWDPNKGDAAGVDGVAREYGAITGSTGDIKKIFHEFNVNSGGSVIKKQREYLRGQGVFGVG
jgi:hypothetical protein